MTPAESSTETADDVERPTPVEVEWPEDRPELLPFLPLIHAAWADGVLTPRELEALCGHIESQSWLDDEDRDRLVAWLDPEKPPDPESLARMGALIRDRGRSVPPEDRGSLSSLGLALSRRAAGGPLGPWRSDEAREELHEMERSLGIAGAEAVRSVLSAPGPTAPEKEEAPAPPPFDVEALRSFLDQPYAELRQHVMEILGRPELRMPWEIDRASYRQAVLDAVRVLADEGIGGLAFPVEHGGAGSPGRMVTAFETLAFGDISVLVKFGVQFGLFGGSVYQLGTRKHHERYLNDVATLELPGAYAMTEMAHGSNVRDIETTATWDPERDAFVVHTPHEAARKDWIGNAALHGRMATVFARLVVNDEDHGVHALLVPIRDEDGATMPGVEIEDRGPKQGLNGIDNGILRFHEVAVPRENLLDRFGRVDEEGRYESPIPSPGRRFFTMLGTLVGGRVSIAAASVSAAKTGLTIAVRYSDRRRQFGPSGEPEVPILDYLVHQRLLLPRLATTYALHFAVRDLVDRYENSQVKPHEPGAREVEVLAAGLKAYASRHCVETLQACREACGGRGYLAANRFGRLRADTDVFTTFEGANPVLLQLVAKGLLSEYREEMGDLRLWGAVRWVADRAQTRVTELNPVVTRRTEEEHLRDPDFHRSAFEYREERLLSSAGRRLKALLDDGMDTFEAMNHCQDHLVTLARAHVERHLLQCFREAVERAPGGEDGDQRDEEQGDG
ncbi:MAG: acyl-CoA dehydrogenase family protein, partial [Gemmatimonadota bacterium]